MARDLIVGTILSTVLATRLELVIKNVAGEKQRRFRWFKNSAAARRGPFTDRRSRLLSKTKYAGLCALGIEAFYVLCLAYGLMLSGNARKLHQSLLSFSHGLRGEIP